jgi:predicted RNase H-like HicB family nuclease
MLKTPCQCLMIAPEYCHGDKGDNKMEQLKIIVEKHPDGYVAYPLGLKGIVVGQGDTYEQALSDVKSAIRFHIETFGPEVLEMDPPILEAFVAEAGVEL